MGLNMIYLEGDGFGLYEKKRNLLYLDTGWFQPSSLETNCPPSPSASTPHFLKC